MYRECISKNEFIAIKNYAIRIKDIVLFDVNPENKTIKITLRNGTKLKAKFKSKIEFNVCLDSVFQTISVIDYHHPLEFFNRGWNV